MAQFEELDRVLVQILNGQSLPLLSEFCSEDRWQQLYQRAQRHGLAPLVYWHARQGRLPIPQPLFEQFKQAYLATLARNRIFYNELERVVSALTGQGIAVVLLKGAMFARMLYEDIGLRPMSDLDILVRKTDIPQAVSLLKENGYIEPVLHQSELLKQDVTHDVHLRQSQPPNVDIEVHWLLVGGERFRQKTDMDWFWQRVVPFEGWPEGVYTLSPTAHLLYLCGHLGFQHGLGSIGLLWLVDIRRFLAKYKHVIDWEEFVAGAKHHSWSASAYYTFREVQKYFLQAPPETVLEQLRFQMTPEEEKQVIALSRMAPSRVGLAWTQFHQLDWAAKLRNVIGRLFPSLAFMRQRYGFRSNWQAILGYPIRWVDLMQVFLKYLQARNKGKR
ncbi:MAG: nucleotidyltransferase family protein [Anaerolineales bacterium]